jgi:hypothetical protein
LTRLIAVGCGLEDQLRVIASSRLILDAIVGLQEVRLGIVIGIESCAGDWSALMQTILDCGQIDDIEGSWDHVLVRLALLGSKWSAQ